MIPFRYNVRNLVVRKTSTAAAALGIALVVFVVAGVFMFSAGLKSALGSSGRKDVALVLSRGSGNEVRSGIPASAVGPLLVAPMVQRGAAAAPLAVTEIVAGLRLERASGAQTTNVQLRGVSEPSIEFRKLRVIEGRALRAGAGEAMLGKSLRGRFTGAEIGGKIKLPNGRAVDVVGVFESSAPAAESEVWVDIDAVRDAFGFAGFVSSVRVQLDRPESLDAFKAFVETTGGDGFNVLREDVYYEKQAGGMNVLIEAVALFIAFLTAVGATLGATITMHTSVSQRRREIGTLRALGFRRSGIVISFLLESSILALAGAVPVLIGAAILSTVTISIPSLASGTEVAIPLRATPGTIGVAVVVSLVMGLVGGLAPALGAARVPPAAALRDS